MTYVDTTLVPEGGYTHVHVKQVYDVIAGAMTTHPAWDYVEYVDSVSGANTYRRYVWKCLAAQSGLPADFFVVFEAAFVTATGSTLGWITTAAMRVYIGETYTAGVLGKFGTNNTSVTLASDLTNPATFTLATYTQPASLWNGGSNVVGTTSVLTSMRYWCLVTKDVIMLSRAAAPNGGNPSTPYVLCVGVYERALSSVADPMPIMVLGSNLGSGTFPGGGATRAPTFAASATIADSFTVANPGSSQGTPESNGFIGHGYTWVNSGYMLGATLGIPASTGWFKSVGGPLVSRVWISTGCTAANLSTRGIFRGYVQHICVGALNTHAYGDTFLVGGRVHVGTANGFLVDTEAV